MKKEKEMTFREWVIYVVFFAIALFVLCMVIHIIKCDGENYVKCEETHIYTFEDPSWLIVSEEGLDAKPKYKIVLLMSGIRHHKPYMVFNNIENARRELKRISKFKEIHCYFVDNKMEITKGME